MLASFKKYEFHEFIMLYINEQMNDLYMMDGEGEADILWYEFLKQLETRQLRTYLFRTEPKLSAKVKSLGKNTSNILSEADSESKVRILT